MIKNNKGTILLITIVSMMILTIIGYITLRMVSSQGVMDTYAQTKVRVDYAAEGIVERAKGYIAYVVDKNFIPSGTVVTDGILGDKGDNPGYGTLFSKVQAAGGSWDLFNAEIIDDDLSEYGGRVNPNDPFDDMFPRVFASVKCEFVNILDPEAIDDGITDIHNFEQEVISGDPTPEQTYRIVGIARATVSAADGSEIVSIVKCYFNTERVDSDSSTNANYTNVRTIIGWRKVS
jgi:hypothetical protein